MLLGALVISRYNAPFSRSKDDPSKSCIQIRRVSRYTNNMAPHFMGFVSVFRDDRTSRLLKADEIRKKKDSISQGRRDREDRRVSLPKPRTKG